MSFFLGDNQSHQQAFIDLDGVRWCLSSTSCLIGAGSTLIFVPLYSCLAGLYSDLSCDSWRPDMSDTLSLTDFEKSGCKRTNVDTSK